MPTPSSTMPVARQLPSRLRQCGAKSARRAPTRGPSTLSGCGRCRSLARAEVLPDFLLPWKGPGRALPAPARKGGSYVTVLCVVDGGEPNRSNTEGLGAVFLDDVFVLVLTSFCLAKVTDEPVTRSACLMARTRD